MVRNSYSLERFDRAVCIESLSRHLQLAKRLRQIKGLWNAMIACLLATYARVMPPTNDDPEESHDCPFRDLGLLSYYRTSGYYQTHLNVKSIPPELLGYAMANAFWMRPQGPIRSIFLYTMPQGSRQVARGMFLP